MSQPELSHNQVSVKPEKLTVSTNKSAVGYLEQMSKFDFVTVITRAIQTPQLLTIQVLEFEHV